ncbi:kinesin family member 18/19 [Trichoderma cornu-damae]|uniref:Kinesin family member 18/19 n=1 Tax=Trichoderma cornu-damae TaxID=654480 RepID=A0A9P8QVE6_9HYPO|nr:kinesin family member 18/19 [Trichoderma cornu-damae]
MGKKKRGHPDVEEILSRPWCYYCERDFEDLKLLISHQKAKHFKCDRCGRRLNTAGGLSVHLNQVHKETLSQVENALPNRQGLEVEIFGMEGIPQEVLEQHRNRIIQNFYQAQEDRRIATGNPPPGQSKNPRKKIKMETAEELLKRFAEYRTQRKVAAASGGAMEGVVQSNTSFPQQAFNQPGFPGQQPHGQTAYGFSTESLPARPSSNLGGAPGLPQRPTQPGFWGGAAQASASGDEIDQLIRMAEAGVKPQKKAEDGEETGEVKVKKDKDKKGRMVYDDAEFSPEEKMAALPRYAYIPPRNDDGTIFLGDGSFASAPTPKLHQRGIRNVIKVVDDRCLIFDPPEDSPVQKFSRTVVPASKKVKDQVFAFDRVFDDNTTQAEVYEGTTRSLLDSVLDGYNATVFAYGATGCGKTHTITGTAQHPGIIFLTMQELFEKIEERSQEKQTELTLSYLEIYNETIRDLLVPGGSKVGLALREDSNQAVAVPGLTSHRPRDVQEVMDMIVQGNEYRTVSPTEANATSSRSHAVLQINIAQKDRNADVNEPHTMATLSIIDLAGSERASVTKNRGERLTEGANINKSLLALGGCINALCDKRGKAHVPYRNSKLTRLLKFSLGGNCKTVMIVCVSPSSAHYDETQNTLRYANRAKNIQTKVTRNVFNVNRHVKDFLIKIDEQMALINELRAQQRDSERVSYAKFRKQYEKREGIAREATQRLRAAYDNAGAERQERINTLRKLKHFERRISLLSAWIAAFDAVANQKEDEEEMPQSLGAIRKTAQGILLELENSRHHVHQKLDKSTWERHLDTALAHGIKQLEHAEGADTGEIASLTREVELLKANFNRETYREVLEQEKAGDAAMMQMILTAQFEMISSLSGVLSMDEDGAVNHAKDVISRLLETGLTAASQVVKPDGSLPAVPDALPSVRRTLRKRKSLSGYRPLVPPAIVAVQSEHVFASPMKSTPRRRKALGMTKKGVSFTPVKRAAKSRGVRWRDDETEDGTLADFEKTPQKLFSSPAPAQPSPGARSKIPSPPQFNNVTKGDASNDDTMSLEMSDAPSLSIAKPGRFQAGFLSRGARFSSMGSGLPVSSSPPALSMHLRSSSSPDVDRTPPLRSLEGPKTDNMSPLSVSKVPRPSPQYHPLQAVMDENNPPNASGSDSESSTIDMRKLRSAIASKKPRRMSLVAPTSVPVTRRVSSIGPASGDRPASRSSMPILASATNGISRLRRGSLECRKSPPLMCPPPELKPDGNLTAGQARRMNMGGGLRLENLGAAQRDGIGLEGPRRVTISVGTGSAAAGVSAHRRLDSRGGMPLR